MMVIFVLSVGMILIIYSFLGLKKEFSSFENILHNNVDNIDKEHIEIGTLRKEMAETIMDLQREIEILKDDIKKVKDFNKDYNDLNVNFSYKNADNKKGYCKDDVNLNSNNNVERKVSINNKDCVKEKVYKLISEGYSIEQISNELNLGRGEVLLIRDLYTKQNPL